jgi:hypothetical protein
MLLVKMFVNDESPGNGLRIEPRTYQLVGRPQACLLQQDTYTRGGEGVATHVLFSYCPASQVKRRPKCDRIASSHPLSWPCIEMCPLIRFHQNLSDFLGERSSVPNYPSPIPNT